MRPGFCLKLIMKPELTSIFPILLTLLLVGCAKDEGGSEDAGNQSESIIRQIAGNAAIGRPARWSNNCLTETACTRADDAGNYRLATEADGSSLMWSDVPLGDGTTQRIYSRYRWQDEITTTLVNINPSTHAVLDIWSTLSQGVSIDSCADSPACETALLTSLSESQEEIIIEQLDALMGAAWPADRNPFDDIYTADPSIDALDDMHDHFLFFVDGQEQLFQVYNNEGSEPIVEVSLASLTAPRSASALALTDDQIATATSIEPAAELSNPITLNLSASPGRPTQVPFLVTLSAADSSSPFGDLTFTHDLSFPDGTTQQFTGDQIDIEFTQGGNHIWVVTAVDPSGRSRIDGLVLTALSGDEEPTFGGEGSCITPASAMTANTYNVCEEPQNGGQYQCDSLSAPSVTLIKSPAPCPLQSQNDGELLGLCTILSNEVRVLFYENPLRPNNTETLAEKQTRVADYCQKNFGGDWSTSP